MHLNVQPDQEQALIEEVFTCEVRYPIHPMHWPEFSAESEAVLRAHFEWNTGEMVE